MQMLKDYAKDLESIIGARISRLYTMPAYPVVDAVQVKALENGGVSIVFHTNEVYNSDGYIPKTIRLEYATAEQLAQNMGRDLETLGDKVNDKMKATVITVATAQCSRISHVARLAAHYSEQHLVFSMFASNMDRVGDELLKVIEKKENMSV